MQNLRTPILPEYIFFLPFSFLWAPSSIKMALPTFNSQKKPAFASKSKPMKQSKSKIAKGKFSKVMVLKGKKEKTVGGLKAGDLMTNKRGKVVSKRKAAIGKRNFRHIEPWTDSVLEARAALCARGFVAINGETLQGKALYVKAKSLYMQRKMASRVLPTVPSDPGLSPLLSSCTEPAVQVAQSQGGA